MSAQCQTCGAALAHDEFPCASCIPQNILAVMLDAIRRERDSLRARVLQMHAANSELLHDAEGLRAQLHLANVDAANREAEANDLRSQLAAAQHVPADAELDALVERAEAAGVWGIATAITALRRRVAEADKALRDMPSVEHSNHFDATGGSGTGCPACIRQWDWRHAHSAAIDAARKGAADAE